MMIAPAAAAMLSRVKVGCLEWISNYRSYCLANPFSRVKSVGMAKLNPVAHSTEELDLG